LEQILARLAPEWAAGLVRRRFFTPPRAPLREAEREILDNARRFRIESDGLPLVGWRWGEGPVVVLVHDWGGHAGQMTGLVAPLVAAGFEVLAFDLPGHGLSGGERSSVLCGARALFAVADLVGRVEAIVAHSFGAAAATLAFAQGLEARRAVFLAPPSSFEGIWARARAGMGVPPAIWQRMRRGAEAAAGVNLGKLHPVVLAPRLWLPLLVLHDAGDREIPFAEGAALAAAWPGARLHRVEGLGHRGLLKDPECLRRTVEFLAPPKPRRATAPAEFASAA
jgi:pimeloyl-ACP methyl ester carboxylesterase